MKTRILFTLLLALVALGARAQRVVSGAVTDSVGVALPAANVQILHGADSSTAAFQTTGSDGKFMIALEKDGAYLLKVSYMGYKNFKKPFKVENGKAPQAFKVKLLVSDFFLNTVEVSGEGLAARVTQDTVRYNLKKLTDGSEENLREVLEKLPGIEINEAGKIMANGEQVDKLLVEGKEFFSEQHSLATENISAEMVDSVALYNDYKGFDHQGDFETDKKTAVNIGIKDEYKGKWTGNVSMAAGVRDKYEGKANLFSFRRESQVGFIANANNTGEKTLTFRDFIDMQGGFAAMMDDNNLISMDDIPDFVNWGDGVRNREGATGALHMNFFPSEKLRVNALGLLNRTTQDREENTLTRYIDAGGATVNDRLRSRGKYWFGHTLGKLIWKPEKGSVWTYQLSYSPTASESDTDTDNNFNGEESVYADARDENSFSLKNGLKWNRHIGKDLLLTTKAHYLRSRSGSDMDLSGNREFLNLDFENGEYRYTQDKSIEKDAWGAQTALAKRMGDFLLRAEAGVSAEKNELRLERSTNLDGTQGGEGPAVFTLNSARYFSGLKLSNNKSDLEYSFGARLNYLRLETGAEQSRLYLEPFADASYSFGPSHRISTGWRRDSPSPSFGWLSPYAEARSFRSVYRGGLDAGASSPAHTVRVSYSLFDGFNGIATNAGLNYRRAENTPGSRTALTRQLSELSPVFLPGEESFGGRASFSKAMESVPFKLSFSANFSLRDGYSYWQGEERATEAETYGGRTSLQSMFGTAFNFELAYAYSRSENEVEGQDRSARLYGHRPLVSFRGQVAKSLRWRVKYEYGISDTGDRKLVNELLDASLRYHKKKSKWAYELIAKNILNLSRTRQLENRQEQNYFLTRAYSALPGYMALRVKYKL
ncbi:TonB-dependent receptor [Fulvitalea axinellae]|uniref:TonB-dependent receptor n=1 Tax=Fulvitalea axinellae TaxID=1182444 RepID=A0AAU9D507_9BACT|nr:TonB-dependent receptor [Fulvitalea axinellae]